MNNDNDLDEQKRNLAEEAMLASANDTPVDDKKGQDDKAPTLREAIIEHATEDEAPHSRNWTMKKILAGDLLSTSTMKEQVWLILLITLFIIIFITNRYAVQKNMIRIDKLQYEIEDARYRALTSNSKLTEKSRESNVLEALKNKKDSVLKTPNQPPYIIKVPENE